MGKVGLREVKKALEECVFSRVELNWGLNRRGVCQRVVGLFSILYISWAKVPPYQSPDLSTPLSTGTGEARG